MWISMLFLFCHFCSPFSFAYVSWKYHVSYDSFYISLRNDRKSWNVPGKVQFPICVYCMKKKREGMDQEYEYILVCCHIPTFITRSHTFIIKHFTKCLVLDLSQSESLHRLLKACRWGITRDSDEAAVRRRCFSNPWRTNAVVSSTSWCIMFCCVRWCVSRWWWIRIEPIGL